MTRVGKLVKARCCGKFEIEYFDWQETPHWLQLLGRARYRRFEYTWGMIHGEGGLWVYSDTKKELPE